MKIINLDENVLKALDFFNNNKPPKLNLDQFQLPFVVGSGNAFNTGKILFADKAAVFADESNYKSVLKAFKPAMDKKLITQALVISSSGEKDSIWEVQESKKNNLHTTLLTCSADCTAGKYADKVIVYKKIAEPYTYNVSTYLGMMLSTTNEDVKLVKQQLEKAQFPENFNSYESYSFVLPDNYVNICPMIDIKKSELFGPHLSMRAFSSGHARHAKFVIPWEKELVISIGEKNEFYGHPDHRWDIDLSKSTNSGTMLSLTYYIVGKIQAAKNDYFKQNIENYCNDYGPKAYGKKEVLEVIVPGTKE